MPMLQKIIDHGLCCGCGTCISFCPSKCISIVEMPYGLLEAKINGGCIECGICSKVCPQLTYKIFKNEQINKSNEFEENAYLINALAPNLKMNCQTGGFVRGILAFLFETNKIQGVLSLSSAPKNPLRPESSLLTSVSDIINMPRSEYVPVSLNHNLNNLVNFKGKIAIVGLPCHLQGISLACKFNKILNEKIYIKMGLFCAGVHKYSYIDYLLKISKTNKNNVSKFIFRDTSQSGWPGNINIESSDNIKKQLNRKIRTSAKDFFAASYCNVCIDKVCSASDIAVGDPYALASGSSVPSVVISRNSLSEKIISEAVNADYIEIKEKNIDINNIERGQAITMHYKNRMKYAFARKALGMKIPALTITYLKAQPSFTGMFGILYEKGTKTKFGIFILDHLNYHFVLFYSYTKKSILRITNKISKIFTHSSDKK